MPLTRLGVGELSRPVRLLEIGAEYEVVVGSDVVSRFTVELPADDSPPAFAGVRAAAFRRYYSSFASCGPEAGSEIELVHEPLPADVAFLSVGVRRHGPGEAPRRQLLRTDDARTGDRRDLTVLSSTCGDPAPPLDVEGTYCVSLAAHDAAGNTSGGEVEVCGPVIDCRNPAWYQVLQCPPPYAGPWSAGGPDEIALKEVTVPTWPGRAARVVGSLVAVLVLFVWWRRRRRRRCARASRWAPLD